ncbi:hypothetical protein REPUB_Repub17cG0096400 [Reevesia pubescens]
MILQLAFQSLGIVYGDLGTSPLYVLPSTFSDGIKHRDDILGVYSLIFYTFTLLPSVKYILIVLRATDNGDGTFALYSLICRYAKVSLIPSQQAEDHDVSNFRIELPSRRLKRASALKSKLEKSQFAKYFLLLVTMLGTSMLIGDGILTPSISVLSAVGGIKQATPAMTEGGKIGPLNAGAEALFADVGHFTVLSIQISTCIIVYPAILLAYTGQASFLREHEQYGADAFYKSLPGPLYWPMFVIAVLASVIGSQSMISGTFSVIQRSLSLGCFPRVKVIRASAKYQGQVYIPEINYLLMLACVGVALGFRTTDKIGNAYSNSLALILFYPIFIEADYDYVQHAGVAVVFVMILTSALIVLIMIMTWKSSIVFILSYVLVIGLLELLYLSSVLYKFDSGGYLPVALAAILVTLMYVWNSVHRKRAFHPSSKHYLSNIPALHSVLVFVSIKSILVSKVRLEERFLFRRLEPKDRHIFQCVIRYGYKDVQDKQEPSEKRLVEKLKEFIREYFLSSQYQTTAADVDTTDADGELQSEISCENNENQNLFKIESLHQKEKVESLLEHLQ